MPVTTDPFAESTARTLAIRLLDDTLTALRIHGSVILREGYVSPWAIALPDERGLASLIDAGRDTRVVAFHLVEAGQCSLAVAGGEAVVLRAGDAAICFGGLAHRLGHGGRTKAMDLRTLAVDRLNARSPEHHSQPADTSLLCGVFLLSDTALNPMFAALPSVLRASICKDGALHNLTGVASLIADELDRCASVGGFIVDRLLEVLCAGAVRAHLESNSASRGCGWFRGVRDPVVARALSSIHARPGANWSVQRIAAGVHMSPSRFAARFHAAIGDSPMAYVTKWRMNVACRRLKELDASIEMIGSDLGYQSQAAFSRAFRRHVGVSPQAWRRDPVGARG